MTIYFEDRYDPAMDDVITSDIFKHIADLQNIDKHIFTPTALKQFNLNRQKLIERREYLKTIKEYGNGS